ncbi:MAG: T9SS type A sorting domain-containing protein [Tannerella sp.]|jgi:hypothetical protein|nr:T9SS type A sorting domain-containing protein [Tannerella sp.]
MIQKIKKQSLSKTLIISFAFFGLSIGAVTAQDNNKEALLQGIGFTLTPPADATDGTNRNPYGNGTKAFNPQHELYLNHNVGNANRISQTYDRGALIGERHHGRLVHYLRSFSGNFTGNGKRDFVMELSLHSTGGELRLLLRDKNDNELEQLVLTTLPTFAGANDTIKPWEINSVLAAAVGDFNGDGKDEIAIYHPMDEKIVIYGLDEDNKLTLLNDNVYIPRRLDYTLPIVNFHDIYAVSIAAGDLNGDGIDDLAITLSRHSWFRGMDHPYAYATLAILHANPSGNTINFTAVQSPDFTGDNTVIPLRFNNRSGHDANTDRLLRAAGVAIGDIDGDGRNEIVVSGVYTPPDNHHNYARTNYCYEATAYFKGNGAVARGTYESGWFRDAFSIHHGMRDINTVQSRYAPISMVTFKAQGNGFPAHIWAGGIELKLEGNDFTVVDDGRVGRMPNVQFPGWMALPAASVPRLMYEMWPHYETCPFSEPHNADNRHENVERIWYPEVIAGNFDGSLNGKEGIAVVVGTHLKEVQEVPDYRQFDTYRYGVFIRHNTYTGAQSTGTFPNIALLPSAEKVMQAEVNVSTPLVNISLAPLILNDRSAMITFREKSYFFSTPNISAVLQAAPSFSELDYDRGTTSYAVSQGSGSGEKQGITTSSGVKFGIEIEFSFFGLFGSGIDVSRTLTSKIGSEWEKSKEITYTTSFSSGGDQDRVYLTMTPYTKYYYDMFVPETKIPTLIEYQNFKKQHQTLMNSFNPNAHNAVENAMEILKLAKLIEDTDKQIANGANYGDIIPESIVDYTVSMPDNIVRTNLTVDRYDELAEQFGYEKIRNNVLLPTYRWGDPSSYRSNILGLDVFAIGGNNAEDWETVTNSGSASTTKSIEISQSHTLNTTWGASKELEIMVKAGIFTGGGVFGTEYEGGMSSTRTSGVNFSGEVANMPIMAAGYGFSWNFLTHKKRINDAEVFVLEYITKNVNPIGITPSNLILTEPVAGETPSVEITHTNLGFTAAMEWNDSPATFAAGQEYTATITLTAKSGYMFRAFSSNEDIKDFTINEQHLPEFVNNSEGGRELVFTVTFLASGETSISGIQSTNITIYPNPVKDILIINNGQLKVNKVEIIDLSGRSLVALKSPDSQINVSILPRGIYVVKLETDKGVVSKKLIKE